MTILIVALGVLSILLIGALLYAYHCISQMYDEIDRLQIELCDAHLTLFAHRPVEAAQ